MVVLRLIALFGFGILSCGLFADGLGELFLTIHVRHFDGDVSSIQTLCQAHLVDTRTILVSTSCLEPLIQAKKENREAKIAVKLSHVEFPLEDGSVMNSGILPIVVYHPSLDNQEPEKKVYPYGLIFLTQKITTNDSFEHQGYPEHVKPIQEWILEEKSHQTVYFRSSDERNSRYWSFSDSWRHDFLEKAKIDISKKEKTPIEQKEPEEPKQKEEEKKKTFLEQMEKIVKKRQKEKETHLKKIHSTSWDMTSKDLSCPDNAAVDHKHWSVMCREPGLLILSQTVELDDLTLNHEAFRLNIPESYNNGQTQKEMEDKLQNLIKKGKFEESIDLRDQLLGSDENGKANIKGLLEVKRLTIQKGLLELWGEIQGRNMTMEGGLLTGYGKLVIGSTGLVNQGGVIAPGYWNQFINTDKPDSPDTFGGKLTLVGNYTQTGYENEKVGTLRFYVTENKKKELVYDSFHVLGEAQIDGNLQIFVKPGLDLHGKTFSFLRTGMGIQGRFARVEVASGNKWTYIPKLEYSGEELRVTFLRSDLFDQEIIDASHRLRYPRILHHQVYTHRDHEKKFQSFTLDGGFFKGRGDLYLSKKRPFVNCGHMMVGFDTHHAELTIHGDYEQCRSSEPKLATTLSGQLTLTAGEAGYDRLTVSGKAQLAGRLTIVAKDPYSLRGKTITVLKAKSIIGEFDHITVLHSKLKAKPVYTEHEVQISFLSERLEHIAQDQNMKDEDKEILQKIEELDDQGITTPRKILFNMMKNGITMEEHFLKSLALLQAKMDLNGKVKKIIQEYENRFKNQNGNDLRKAIFQRLFEEFKIKLDQACLLHLRFEKEGRPDNLEIRMKEADDSFEEAKALLDRFLTEGEG